MAKGQKTGGRTKGTLNKATADIKAAAQEYSAQALAVLVQVATAGESEAARVAAANSILDRAHGKPKQAVDVGTPDPATGETLGLSEALGWIARALEEHREATD